jgi:hypothetical protein
MLLLVMAGVYLQDRQSPAEQLASKMQRADLVSRMQVNLASASEAEKNAVMAAADDSQAFADQARAASAEVEREYRELDGIMQAAGTPNERTLLAQFAQSLAQFQRIDSDLLTLATRNTNLKAYRLAFGPAAESMGKMHEALAGFIATKAKSAEAAKITWLAFQAQTSALRIQALLAPHIAEERDEKMDQLEASMGKEGVQVHRALDALKAIPSLSDDKDLTSAVESYDKFSKLKIEILALSRENTNVRSLAISLHQKRKVTLLCQETLSALKQAILDEPIRGVTERPISPR